MRKILIVLFTIHYLLFSATCYASATTDTAWNYFLKGDYRKAITEADKVENNQSHYIMGLSYLKLGKPSHARKHFQFILDMYPGVNIKEETVLCIADSYFLEGDFENAVIKYTNFLKCFPSSGLGSLAYLRLGQSQRRLGCWSDAKASLSKVIKDFPYSFERKEAQKELLKEFYYYVQLGSFSRKINANKLLKSLRIKNFNAYINTIEKDNRTFYRVCIGKFQNRQDAIAAVRKLKADGYTPKIYPQQ